MNHTFTKTETLRRLRVGTRLMRENDRFARNGRVEVGTRNENQVARTAELALTVDESDLFDSFPLVDASRQAVVQQHGYLAHIYIYEPEASGGFLDDVQIVWLGTPDQEPVLLHRQKGLVSA